MYQDRILLTNKDIYEKEFKIDTRGYRPQEVDKFLDLNYNEDSPLNYWTFADFNSFAIDVATEGLRRACRLNDLYYESDDEED